MIVMTITEVVDEGEDCICVTGDDGSITLYPYRDSMERIDQLRNARGDHEGFQVVEKLG
jgi:hypothetical protein